MNGSKACWFWWRRATAAAAIVACLAAAPPPVAAEGDLDLLEEQAFRAAVDRVAPSVVRIETIGGLERVDRVLFGTGPTTGLVLGEDGYVVSSAFNFLNQPSSILVQLPDGTRKAARVVATDHNRMIALLKIDVDAPLPVPEIAPQDGMRVGQWTIAVGRAYETSRPNAAVGILSAKNRIWGKAVQTDAAVSPNNYGGPLVDVYGRVLGVLVPLSPQDTRELAGVEWYDSGIGFAVVAEDIHRVLTRLKEGKDLYPGVAGISFAARSLYTAEPVIAACQPNSPAREAGLKAGDRIVEVSGRKTVRAAQVKQEISRHYAGDTIRLVAMRGQERIECDLQLLEKLDPYQHPFLGVLPMREQGSGEDAPRGVTVRFVYPESPADKAGILAGDVLASLGETPIQDAEQLRVQLAEYQPGEEVELEVRRGGEARKVTVGLASLPEALPPEAIPPARRPGAPPEGRRPEVGTVSLKIPEFPNDAWAYVPESYDPRARYGLVTWLHGPGGLDEKELIARWKPLCDRHDLILLAPKAAEPDKWNPREVALVGKLLDEVQARYNVDGARIVLAGREEGGRLACLVAFRTRELVRAVVSVDARLAGRPPANDPLYRLAFYVALSEGSGHAREIRDGVERLREMKYPVTLKDLGPQPRDLDADELARWIDALDRI